MIFASAQGKINIHFSVSGGRPDGYHEVLSLYQAVGLSEVVGVEPADNWKITIEGELTQEQKSLIPVDESNIVVKAAKGLANFVGIENPQPMHFLIRKGIPVAGGMAGGSADAAAALIALNEAWCLGLDIEKLAQVGAGIGADVPFALIGGTAIGTGTGTTLEPIRSPETFWILLVRSDYGLQTKEVFQRFDKLNPTGDSLPSLAVVTEDFYGFGPSFGYNSLSQAALSLRPELGKLMELEIGISRGVLSGSGPTIWFYSQSLQEIESAKVKLESLGHDAQLTHTVDFGARLL